MEFFKQRGHTIVPSSSLLPDDPSVLLTTAGMQQFKPYYTGVADPFVSPHPTLGGKPLGNKNTASIQKSFRTSDIDQVGDESHLTFFEMLGNFSFGGYFKKEAIQYAYDFLKEIGLEIEYVTVFDPEKVPEGDWRKQGVPFDKESYEIWKSLGVPEAKVQREGIDNFWGPTGREGPCGPTTEIYIAGIEAWNIVFNQFFCDKEKKLTPLKIQGVDTGMGLERLAMVAQNKNTVFETDLFWPIIEEIERLSELKYGDKSDSEYIKAGKQCWVDVRKQFRIIADHVRASAFLISDGVRPSNKEGGYILRKLLRRVIVQAYQLIRSTNPKINSTEISQGIIQKIFVQVIRLYGNVYSELDSRLINLVFNEESVKFLKTLTTGLRELDKITEIDAAAAFKLYESYGLPYEILKDIAPEKTTNLTREDFDKEFARHQEISRAGKERKFGGHGLLLDTGELKAGNEEELKIVTRLHTATHLLQAALRKVLGDSVHQAGSDITVERTRFDFMFERKLTPEEIQKVEDLVNNAIEQDLSMGYEEVPYEKAIQSGALYSPKEKYPPVVRVYTAKNVKIGEVFSKELCGGPHVTHTREIGSIKIAREESVAAGVRRIRAVLVV